MKNNVALADNHSLVTRVSNRVVEMEQEGQINLPEGYSVTNALQAAFFTLTEVDFGKKTSLIDSCTKESVAFALQNMAIQGLSVAKKQGYFVAYGDKLQFQRSYHGTKAIIQRMDGIRDVWANVIWSGDVVEVEYEKGALRVVKHEHDWKSRTGKKQDIEGAYAIVEREDGTQYTEIMTMDEILTAWSTSRNKSVQDKYPQEMAKRTVINRLGKHFINTSDDSDMLALAMHQADESEFEREPRDITAEVEQEIQEEANQVLIDVEPSVDAETGENKEPVMVEPAPAKEEQKQMDVPF